MLFFQAVLWYSFSTFKNDNLEINCLKNNNNVFFLKKKIFGTKTFMGLRHYRWWASVQVTRVRLPSTRRNCLLYLPFKKWFEELECGGGAEGVSFYERCKSLDHWLITNFKYFPYTAQEHGNWQKLYFYDSVKVSCSELVARL